MRGCACNASIHLSMHVYGRHYQAVLAFALRRALPLVVPADAEEVEEGIIADNAGGKPQHATVQGTPRGACLPSAEPRELPKDLRGTSASISHVANASGSVKVAVFR